MSNITTRMTVAGAKCLPRLLATVAIIAGAASLYPLSARAQPAMNFPDRTCDVTSYGAQGTRIWYDTDAFQKAIDDCARQGGGTVLVPRGMYLIGPINLRSNIRLNVEKYAEVVAGSDPALYGTVLPTGTGAGQAARSALINIRDAHNVAIVGEGLIDGQGEVWWEQLRALWRSNPAFAVDGQARQQQHDGRPRLIVASNSQDLLFRDIRLKSSPSYHLVFQDSENITVDHVTIDSPAHASNTDAIDPVNSRNVLIENSTISSGDDIVAIKSSRVDPAHPDAVTSNIVIRNNRITAGRGICIGSGATGGVRHVLVEDNVFVGSMYGLRIKIRRSHGGEVSDVVFRNNRMTDVETPLVFSGYYEYRALDPAAAQRQLAGNGFVLGNQFWPDESDPPLPYVRNQTPDIHDITVENLVATGAQRVGIAVGLPERVIQELHLKNVRIEAQSGFVVRNARVDADRTSFTVKKGPAVLRQKAGVFAESSNR